MSSEKYPEPVVGAFIFNKEGKLFLMKSHKWNDSFSVPGGHIEYGEKIEDALRREVNEETGLSIYDQKFICLWDFIEESGYWKKKHMIFLNFLAKTESSDVCLNHEAHEYIWTSPDDALKLPLERYAKLTIEGYLLHQK